LDVDRALEEGQVIVEAVEILRPPHLGDRQIRPEGVFEQIKIRQDDESEKPEGCHGDENGRQRQPVAAQQIVHAETAFTVGVSSARLTARSGSKTMSSLSPGDGTDAWPSLRASDTRMLPPGSRAWMLMKLPSKATSATSTGIAFSPFSRWLTSRACSGRT